jgi:deazaflavin-dependent oxidoreductase (nitroreductase family)
MSTNDAERQRAADQYRADPVGANRVVIERYRASGGGPGTGFGGADRMLLLTTTGARTGRTHTAPMMYVRDGDRLVVFASNAGAPRRPAWYHNLVAHPAATVELGDERFAVTAAVSAGEERQRLWRLFPFPEHEERAGRRIPVVVLRRAG